MLHLIDCDIINLFSRDSSSCYIWLIVILFICVRMVLPHVALYWLWQCLSVFLWFFLMLHWIDFGIVYLCSHGASSCCIGLIVTLFICVLMVLPHVTLDWLWYRFFYVFMVLRHVAFDLLWHCLSLFSWFFLMLHWIDCDIVYLCFHGSSSCRIGLIVTLFICVLMGLPRVALNWLWHCLSVFLWVFLMLHWIDCDIVYLCSYGSFNVALNWLWHCLSVFSWFFLMSHWIDCDIVYLCSYGFFSFCIRLNVTLFICGSWFFLMLHWIDCDILYLCSYGSSSCCIGLIVTLFISVFMVLPRVALDWLWHCLSVFSWFFLILHWIYCDIVYLCSHGSFSCCIGLIVTLFICVLLVLPRAALDWLWHCLSVFSWCFLMLHWIDCDIVYLFSHGSSSCCLGLIVTLFICVLMVLSHVALDWL